MYQIKLINVAIKKQSFVCWFKLGLKCRFALSLQPLSTNVIKVATTKVLTVNTYVLVTRVLKVETLGTNVCKSQKGKLKR